MPIDAIAASMAASAVLTISRECTGTEISDFADAKIQASDDVNPANVMQSCELSSLGFFGRPRSAKYAGLAHMIRRIAPNRVATRLLSGKAPIRMARST